jgi:hypothetical protein
MENFISPTTGGLPVSPPTAPGLPSARATWRTPTRRPGPRALMSLGHSRSPRRPAI